MSIQRYLVSGLKLENSTDMWASPNAIRFVKFEDHQSEIAELTKRLEAAELNAARYEFLRTRDLDSIHLGGIFAGVTTKNIVLNGVDLDIAIDARLLEQGGRE